MSEGDEPFDWGLLVPHIVHPTKVAIIEAIGYLDRPLSASELSKLFGGKGKVETAHVSYHVVSLAKAEVLTAMRTRRVRGSVETFYFFTQ